MMISSPYSRWNPEWNTDTQVPPDTPLEEFKQRPYVFEGPMCQKELMFIGQTDIVWFHVGFHGMILIYKGSKEVGWINQGTDGWKYYSDYGSTLHGSLLEAVEVATKGVELAKFSNPPGMVSDSPEGYLLSKPNGTCLLKFETRHTLAYINYDGQIICEILSRDIVNRGIIQHLAARKSLPADLSEKLTLCTSILDLSSLSNFTDQCRKRVISEFQESQFENIDCIVIKECSLSCYKDIVIYLAKIGKFDVTIHISKPLQLNNMPDYIADLRECLQGDKLDWAFDRIFEVFLYSESKSDTQLQVPLVEPVKQRFYDNPKYGADLQVRGIWVNKRELAIFSETFEKMFFGGLPETNCSLDEIPDEEVTQLLRVIYGFKPDFSKCSSFELLRLADYIQSELFINLVNDHLNKTLPSDEELLRIMMSDFWQRLPQTKQFLNYVSGRWRVLIESLAEEEQKRLRTDFYNAWLSQGEERQSSLKLL